MLFAIIYNLCKEYPAFTPLELDETSFYEVIELYSDTRKIQIDQEKHAKTIASSSDRVYVPTQRNDW